MRKLRHKEIKCHAYSFTASKMYLECKPGHVSSRDDLKHYILKEHRTTNTNKHTHTQAAGKKSKDEYRGKQPHQKAQWEIYEDSVR